jgi:hypothetical protein
MKSINNRCDIQGLSSTYSIQHHLKKTIEKYVHKRSREKTKRNAAAVCDTRQIIFL